MTNSWSLLALLAAVAARTLALPAQTSEELLLLERQANPLNPFLAVLVGLPPISLLVEGAEDVLTKVETLLVPLSGGPPSQSDLARGKACADLTIVWARGTTEPGNIGVFTGPQFINAVEHSLPRTSINVQGVEYAADIQGYLSGGGQDGTASMNQFVNQAATECPGTEIVMAGYSQGGQVVHNTAETLDASVMARVSSVVIFGDPKSKQAVKGAEDRTLIVCHKDDDVCSFGDIIGPSHLTYGIKDAPKGGAFVARNFRGGGFADDLAIANMTAIAAMIPEDPAAAAVNSSATSVSGSAATDAPGPDLLPGKANSSSVVSVPSSSSSSSPEASAPANVDVAQTQNGASVQGSGASHVRGGITSFSGVWASCGMALGLCLLLL